MAFLNELELKIEARTPIFSFQICNLHPIKYHKRKFGQKQTNRDDQKTLQVLESILAGAILNN